MGRFTVVPIWIFQDLVVYALGVYVLLFILRREAHPASAVLEAIGFCFLYAAVYENFATLMGWYGYGRSLLMVFNVPFSVPLVEYLVVYASLRILDREGIPAWSKPWMAGLAGMVFDFSLDPLAMKQVFDTREGRIGRWTWYPGAADVQILGEPVYNYTGWILLCGIYAAAVIAGRYWHRRSGYRPWVGYVYPLIAALAALLVLVSPLSQFLIWLAPFFGKGSVGEWIALGLHAAAGTFLLARFAFPAIRRSRLGGEGAGAPVDAPALLVLVGLPLLNFVLCLAGGYWDALLLVAPAAFILAGAVLLGLRARGP